MAGKAKRKSQQQPDEPARPGLPGRIGEWWFNMWHDAAPDAVSELRGMIDFDDDDYEDDDEDDFAAPAAATDRKAPEPEESPPPAGWPEPRLKVAQAIWGEEFTTPGGHDVVMGMITPLALNEKMSVVDIGAGLGGSTRSIARETGAWVNGYDEDAELAAAAMKLSKMGALGKRAPIETCDLNAFADVGIRDNSIHAVFSKEALFTVADKDALLETMETIMKPGGQLMMTDYMAADGMGESGAEDEAESQAIKLWSRFEPRRPHLWDVGRFRNKFESMNYEVRVAEDITEKQRGYVLHGFLEFTTALKTFKPIFPR
jgi:ubiquinone/menaquinone biosynthesis C-methylase UbiE